MRSSLTKISIISAIMLDTLGTLCMQNSALSQNSTNNDPYFDPSKNISYNGESFSERKYSLLKEFLEITARDTIGASKAGTYGYPHKSMLASGILDSLKNYNPQRIDDHYDYYDVNTVAGLVVVYIAEYNQIWKSQMEGIISPTYRSVALQNTKTNIDTCTKTICKILEQ